MAAAVHGHTQHGDGLRSSQIAQSKKYTRKLSAWSTCADKCVDCSPVDVLGRFALTVSCRVFFCSRNGGQNTVKRAFLGPVYNEAFQISALHIERGMSSMVQIKLEMCTFRTSMILTRASFKSSWTSSTFTVPCMATARGSCPRACVRPVPLRR